MSSIYEGEIMPRMTPAQKVLEKVFGDYISDGNMNEPEDDVWEVFVSDLLLRQQSIDDEEVRSGIVDGSQDGGVDGFYTFLNGTLVQTDHPALQSEKIASKQVGDSPSIEVLLTQSKNKNSWQESALEKLLSSIPTLLDQANSEQYLLERFNSDLVNQVTMYRTLAENLAVKFPRFKFRVAYVTKAPEASITTSLEDKALQLENLIGSLLTPGAVVSCELIGADGLYQIAGTAYSDPAELRLRNAMIREEGSFIGIAEIKDYLSFVRNKDDELRTEMFESNVRDYEGSNQVNRSI